MGELAKTPASRVSCMGILAFHHDLVTMTSLRLLGYCAATHRILFAVLGLARALTRAGLTCFGIFR